MTTYKPVKITPFFCKKGVPRDILPVTDLREVIDSEKNDRILCEYIEHSEDINPYADADYKIPNEADLSVEKIKFISDKLNKECIQMINQILKDYDGKYHIYEADKKSRVYYDKKKEYIKISQRYFIKGLKVKASNWNLLIKQHQCGIDNSPFDLKVYNDGRIMILPEFYKPWSSDDPSKTILLPKEANYDINNYTITGISSDDLDLNDYVRDIVKCDVDNKSISNSVVSENIEKFNILFNPEETIGKCKRFVGGLTSETADSYDKWRDVGFALKNLGAKYLFSNKAFEMFKYFSKKSIKYEEGEVIDFWNGLKVGGKKAAGLPKLQELYLADIRKDEEEELLKTKGYDIIKKSFEDKVCKVLADGTFIRQDGEDTYYIKKESLKITYSNLYYYFKGKNDSFGKDLFIDKWLRDEDMKQVRKITFDPSKKCGDDVYNKFKGFRAEFLPPVPDKDVDDLIEPILKHYREVLYGEHWEYVVELDRQIIKNPTEKSGIIVVLKGEQGIGKDCIMDLFLRCKIIGTEYASQCGGITPLFERFETYTPNKLLTICDEVNVQEFMKDKVLNEKVKNLTARETTDWEVKGVTKISIPNYTNLRWSSNNEYPVNISADDRRFCVFECSNKYKRDEVYMSSLIDACKSDKVARAYYQYLLRGPIKYKNTQEFQKNRPLTDYYKELVVANLQPIDRFLSYICINGTHLTNGIEKELDSNILTYKGFSFYQIFREWCMARKWECNTTCTAFGRKLGGITKDNKNAIDKTKNSDVIYILNLEQLEVYLKSKSRFDEDIF